MASGRESLTISLGADTLAPLNASTPQGDDRRNTLGVLLAPGTRSREPGPAAATVDRPAEAPAADQTGGPCVLGRAAPSVVGMGGCGRHREARDRDRLAPRGLRTLLEVALEDGKTAWSAYVARQVRDLVRRMESENGWGAPRIRGELLKLGFSVSERTASRYMRQHRRWPERRQRWLTFLRNHREVIVAMDFFVVPTARFSRCRRAPSCFPLRPESPSHGAGRPGVRGGLSVRLGAQSGGTRGRTADASAREDVFRSDSLPKGATRHCLTSWLMLDIDV
jgi:hypothetical protein